VHNYYIVFRLDKYKYIALCVTEQVIEQECRVNIIYQVGLNIRNSRKTKMVKKNYNNKINLKLYRIIYKNDELKKHYGLPGGEGIQCNNDLQYYNLYCI